MGKVPYLRAILILGIVFTLSACTPGNKDSNTPAEPTPTEVTEPLQANLVISSAGLE